MQQGRDCRSAGGPAVGEHAQSGGDAVGREENVLIRMLLRQDRIEIEGEAIDAFFEISCGGRFGCGDLGRWFGFEIGADQVRTGADEGIG